VLERRPPFGESREAAFGEAAQGSEQGVVDAVVDAEVVAVGGLLNGVWMP
jgi:hypothetical protein